MNYLLPYVKKLHSFAGRVLYYNLLGGGLISFLEGISILLLIPMLNITGVVQPNMGSSLSAIFSFLQQFPHTIGLPVVLGIFFILVIGQNLLQRKLTVQKVRIISGFINRLKNELYGDLLQANWEFFLKKRRSDLINLLTTEMGTVTGGINILLQLSTSLVFTLIQIVFAFWLSAKMTAFVVLFGCLLAFFSRTFIKKSNKLANKTSELLKNYLAGITDQLNGVKDIKSNTLEKSRITWHDSMTKQIQGEQLVNIHLKTSSQLVYKIVSSGLIVLFIFSSVSFFRAQPEQFILIIVIFSRLWPKFMGIQSNLEQLASVVPAFKSLSEIQQQSKKAKEILQFNFIVEPIRLKQGLECKNVCFRYNRDKQLYALQNINMYIPANRTTAIVGRSGAGKSTLIDILMGLMMPERGQVLVDGIPLSNENVGSFRETISYVPQDPFLYNESIRDNLLMIQPNASDEQIWEALKFAAADNFVRNLPLGLDTAIGDRGIRLSGGERQRLVLARAILRKPAILLLDEATSALDSENEAKIQEALERIRGTMTIIVIAHRLSTIQNADQVIVLEQGQVIQKGGFAELAKEKEGLFSSLLDKQMPEKARAL